MIRWPSAVRDSTEAELAAFDAVCARLEGFDPDLNYEYVDGWLTALAAGPVVPAAEVWLPRLCADTFERVFADPADADQARAALQARLVVLLAQLDPEVLLDHPEAPRLSPLVTDVPEGGEGGSGLPPLGTAWALGFLDGCGEIAAIWPKAEGERACAELEALLEVLDLLTETPGEGAYDRLLAEQWPEHQPTRDEMLGAAIFAVQDLRVFWLDNAPRPKTRHVEATPGRNDPCPCGSGKKYKKCHGAAV